MWWSPPSCCTNGWASKPPLGTAVDEGRGTDATVVLSRIGDFGAGGGGALNGELNGELTTGVGSARIAASCVSARVVASSVSTRVAASSVSTRVAASSLVLLLLHAPSSSLDEHCTVSLSPASSSTVAAAARVRARARSRAAPLRSSRIRSSRRHTARTASAPSSSSSMPHNPADCDAGNCVGFAGIRAIFSLWDAKRRSAPACARAGPATRP